MDESSRQRTHRVKVGIVSVLFLAQFVALLWVGSYASVGPEFYGIPFFYWYSVLWLIVGAISMGVAFALLRHPVGHEVSAGTADEGGRTPGGGQ
ncbi:MAG: DUF3311 domain-containing protein [Acidimicrobiales bacterium]